MPCHRLEKASTLYIRTHSREASKQVIERAPHSPGDVTKFLPRMLQWNHPPSLPPPEHEGFLWLPIRLLTYHDELLAVLVFHEKPLHIHTTALLLLSDYTHRQHTDLLVLQAAP